MRLTNLRGPLAAAGLAICTCTAQAELVARYTFDEAASGNAPALDSGVTAPAANGTFSGAATRTANTPGGFSTGALDASNGGMVATADAAKLDELDQITVSFWMNLQGDPGNSLILSDSDPTFSTPPGNGGWEVGFFGDPADAAGAYFGVNESLGATGLISRPLDADNRWVFVGMTYDTLSETIFIYAGSETDSVSFNNAVSGVGIGLLPNTAGLLMGAVDGDVSVLLDDVRIYDVALTGTALETIRLENVPEPASGLLLVLGLGLLARRR